MRPLRHGVAHLRIHIVVFVMACCAAVCATLGACGGDRGSAVLTPPGNDTTHDTTTIPTLQTLQTLGLGSDTLHYTSEAAVRGTIAYTTTWTVRHLAGNTINVWDVSGNTPQLVDTLQLLNALITGDVEVSDDGALLVVATEYSPGSIAIFSLADPVHPQLITRFSNADTDPGVHTAKLGRVNGTLYAFLCIDPVGSTPAKLVIVDLSTPSAPREVYAKTTGNPYVHDTFLRDGLLFVALWDDGLQIWDVGGGGTGGTPESPHVLGGVKTVGGETHNVWWYHDASGGKRYAFVGQEGPGTVGTSSQGDIHVLDVSDFTNPREVAFYHVNGAGTHNFAVDEANGILYAAYYNAGVRAIDVHGDLGTCLPSQQSVSTTPSLTRCDLRLMGRELAVGLLDQDRPVYDWGVKYAGGYLYASDMLNGIWKLKALK